MYLNKNANLNFTMAFDGYVTVQIGRAFMTHRGVHWDSASNLYIFQPIHPDSKIEKLFGSTDVLSVPCCVAKYAFNIEPRLVGAHSCQATNARAPPRDSRGRFKEFKETRR